jgi:hypothetical protein
VSTIRKSLLLVIKMIVIVIFPYYFVNSSTRTTSISNMVGTWGQWPREIFAPPFPDVFWESYQIFIALLFIVPLAIFSFVYQQKQVDKKCIGAAFVAISISCIIAYLFTPQYGYIDPRWSMFNVVPNVVSLAIFVFVFWPLLHNVWPQLIQ